jgi:predicted ABC-class ATPase
VGGGSQALNNSRCNRNFLAQSILHGLRSKNHRNRALSVSRRSTLSHRIHVLHGSCAASQCARTTSRLVHISRLHNVTELDATRVPATALHPLSALKSLTSLHLPCGDQVDTASIVEAIAAESLWKTPQSETVLQTCTFYCWNRIL